jgi:predicted TIM-barrel fold metal-dependent hydrolase
MMGRHGYGVIDVHTHIHPAATDLMRAVMDANQLAGFVNLGILERLGIPFEEGMRAFRQAFGERMTYFTTPDFRDTQPGFGERMAESLARCADLGARGLKIFKELGLRHRDGDGDLIPVDDARLDPLWATAGRLGLPVLIHTADPLAFFGPLDEHNERREELALHPDWHFGRPEFPGHDEVLAQRNRVLERHPGTTFIGAHLGEYPERLDYVDACLERYPNFCVDTSARIGEIGRHPAEEARAFFLKHADRILFGSDLVYGWNAFGDTDASENVSESQGFYVAHWRFFETDERQIEHPGYPIAGPWRVDAIGLPDEVLQKLYFRNVQRLIPD